MIFGNIIKTRILVLSDTHSLDVASIDIPTHQVDVAIHCGDLTESSSLQEFRSALNLLTTINAPLKLVIPGNHDFTMDPEAFAAKIEESPTPLDPKLVAETYGEVGEAADLLRGAHEAGIMLLLDEGNHRFQLDNGAALRVYASAFTPALGAWGFQYHPDKGHDFQILEGTDVVITHGPPRGILDYTEGRVRAGCPDLFAAVAKSKPRLHCFGHIHEGWGARLVTWKDDYSKMPTHFTSIDNDRSILIANLSSLRVSNHDSPEDVAAKVEKQKQITADRCIRSGHCMNDDFPIRHGESTLFVNAAICDSNGIPNQRIWMTDLDL